MLREVALVCLLGLGLAGCIHTQELPLAQNVVRIDTQSSGLLFTGQTVPTVMRAAAKATLARGYTHFKFANASLQQGAVVSGAIGSSATNVTGTSNTNLTGTYGAGFVNANATTFGAAHASTFGSTTLVHTPVAGAAVTVVMFHADEPGAKGAFDAAQILQQYAR